MTVVQDIKNRSDIVDLVSNYVTLQKAGNNFKANCPFHSERTPSFVVFPDKQTWRCFGACATGGDVLSFIMKAENEDFSEALTRLSKITGVALPTKRENNQSEKIYQINQETMDFFKNVLKSEEGTSARSYIQERGINDETADTFGIGLSPSGRESLIRHLLNAGFTKEEIQVEVKESNLTIEGDASDRHDNSDYVHKGIARRAFQRKFVLNDTVEVEGADLTDGVLHIRLKQNIPEEQRPRQITVN